jgi:hypothetical protein
MAFHPFHMFRRHQKKWLAGITIMCMFIFILQFGRGDALDRMMSFFGASRIKKTTVATVYGKKVTDYDLDDLRRKRELANTIVETMAFIGRETALNDLRQKNALDAFDEIQKITLRDLIRQRDSRNQMDQASAQLGAGARDFWLQFHGFSEPFLSPQQRKDNAFRDHEQLLLMEEGLRAKNQTEQARIVRQFMAVLEFEMWFRDRPATERLYFGGSLRVNDLLDFVMWRDLADKLGITLTHADIRAEIDREALNVQPLEEDENALVTRVQRFQRVPVPNLSADDIYMALGDELRVYLAQSAVLGYPPGVRYYRYVGADVNHVPATATPYEFWKYYQDNRTTLRVEMLPIKVDDFLAEARKLPEPSPQELEDLFNRHKDQEYNPDLDQPAFREPRRVAIEWVSARQDAPHQRKQADQFILSLVAAGPANPLPATALTTLVLDEYQRRTYTFRMPGLLEDSFALAFYRDATKPVDAGAVLAQAMGAIGTGADPVSVVTLYVAGIDARNRAAVAPAVQTETQRRAGIDATMVMVGTNPLLAAGLLRYAEQARQVLPFDVVKKEVFETMRDDMARRFLIDNLKTVQTELEKLKGRPEEARKKEAEKYLAKAIKDYGLSHGTTEKPRDFYDIADDKGLKSLRESYGNNKPRDDPRGRNFAGLFFDAAPSYVPERWPSSRSMFEMFGGGPWERADEPFLYWKTEEKKAYTPEKPQDVWPKIVEAWRYQKARDLALQEAERVQQEVTKAKAQGDGLRLMREVSAQHPAWGEMFVLRDIARLVPVFTGGAVLRQYGPYTPDEDKIKARPDFVDQLMRALKERGDATVVWNRPQTIYYVTYLTDIARPDETKFYADYSSSHVLGDNLWRHMEVERRQRYYHDVMAQLRTEAGADKGKWDVPDDVRTRIEGRESGGEE